jgi:Glycosyltransferase family 87
VVADLPSEIAKALARIALVPRWRLTSIALAALLLALPIPSSSGPVFASFSVEAVEILVLVGVLAGWVLLDRLAAMRVPLGWMAVAVVVIGAGGWLAWHYAGRLGIHLVRGPETVLTVAFAFGSLVRGATDMRRSMASLVTVGAVTSWLTYDLWQIPYLPLRDIHLYLGAGATALAGRSPYLTAPAASIADKNTLPFVYPPLTIPLFELLATVPRPIAEALWIGGSIAAVVVGFWLLGVRGRWLLVLLAWPAPAQGIAVGNVASYTFLLYALGFQIGVMIVLSGVFKVQSLIPTLWLVRERRWRQLGAAVAILAVMALVSVPIVGLRTWFAWPDGLRHFQETLATFPSIEGLSVVRWQGPTVALAITLVVLVLALLARGRRALAGLGLASVVGSPTLSLHGLSPLLAGALVLGPELLWFFLGLGPWLGPWTAWLALVVVGLALLVARDDDLRIPGDLSPSRADLHPAGQTGQPWPVVLRRLTRTRLMKFGRSPRASVDGG